MKKLLSTLAILSLACCTTLAIAKPVKVNITYTNVQALSNKLSQKNCSALFRNATYMLDQNKPRSFKAAPTHTVIDSETVVKTRDGKDQVLVKLGKSKIRTQRGTYRVNRVSYVKIQPNGKASGKLVLEGLCSADFTSDRS